MKPPTLRDPHLIIRKAKRKLELCTGEKLLRSYDIALGSCPVGDKEIEGDGKTPEGEYFVFVKNPKSRFHLSLGLNYPTQKTAERGFVLGLITRIEFDQIVKAQREGQAAPKNQAWRRDLYSWRRDWIRLDGGMRGVGEYGNGGAFRGCSGWNKGEDNAMIGSPRNARCLTVFGNSSILEKMVRI